VAAALRELDEETGLVPDRLYNLSRTETFYRHAADEIAFIPVFAAFVLAAETRLSAEHDQAEWLSLPAAQGRLAWPRERRALEDIQLLLARGNAGPLDDVLRVAVGGPGTYR
jgi:dihydroneopterin triphosphate diphosphatase